MSCAFLLLSSSIPKPFSLMVPGKTVSQRGSMCSRSSMRPKANFTLSKRRLSWYLQALEQVFYSKDASSYIKWFINIKQRFVPEILRVQAEFHSATPQERHTGFRTCHWGRTFQTWWKPSQLSHHKCVSLLFYTSAEYKSRNKITEQ